MKFLGGDTDLTAEAKPTAVGKSGGSVAEYSGSINFLRKFCNSFLISADNRFCMF